MRATWLIGFLVLLLAACGGGGDGLPTAAGEYVVKSRSVSFDGERYNFQWAVPTRGSDLTWARTKDVRLQLDDRTYLDVDGSKQAVLHLTQDEPVTVVRQEQGRQYSSAWYPYYYQPSTTIIVEREYRRPVYVYPPSGSFRDGETLTGNVRSDRPAAPAQIKTLQATSNTVSGQSGGTGGGNAVLNKTGGAAPVAVSTSVAPSSSSGAPSINTSGGSSAPKPAAPPSSAPPVGSSGGQSKVPSISTKK